MTYILGEWEDDRGEERQRRSELGIEMELQEKKEIKIERRGSTDINIIFFIGILEFQWGIHTFQGESFLFLLILNSDRCLGL